MNEWKMVYSSMNTDNTDFFCFNIGRTVTVQKNTYREVELLMAEKNHFKDTIMFE